MAGDAGNVVLGVIIEQAIKPVFDVIGRHLGYLFCYKSNINNLAKTAAQLEKSGMDAENFFKGQRRNNEKPAQSSAGWLDEVKEMVKDAKQIGEATDKLNGCLNIKGRYVMSRKSTKLAVDIQKLKNKAPQGITANIVLPAGSLPGASANESSKGYKTRMQTLDEVMVALEDPAIRFIGLCGMGGVGKTTMLHEVRERARTQSLFDETAMSTVSQKIDLFKIQADLAEMLGLNALKEVKNVIERADQLLKRLTNGNKVLVTLDDVWSDINLGEVGIPVGGEHKECKVLITSRQERVCGVIQKSLEVHALDTKEARDLFRKTVGEHVEKNDLREIADKVADECKGLPIALLTLSRALSNKDRGAWEDALMKLREGHFKGIKGMEQYVYQSIKLSYDFLAKEKLEEAQSLLQLCCQHEEDAEINLEKLARYCLALDLFKGVNGVVRARNRVCYLVGHLKSCFLLQAVDDGDEGEDIERVKVHDVVRDVCCFVASEVKEERDRVCMHIWNKEIDAGIGGTDLDYQKLKLLVEVPFHLTDHLSGIKSFLEQTQELRVLESSRYDWWRDQMDEQSAELSLAPQFSTSLRVLSIEHTTVYPGVMSKFISLTGLKVLSFMGSTLLSFPHQIGQLSNLKLLDLRYRYSSNTPLMLMPMTMPMPSGILPKLKKLEVLFMGIHYFPEAPYSEGEYEGEGEVEKESCPGSIEDLDSLTNLTTLQVDFLDPTQLLDLKCFPFDNLKGFSFGSVGKSPSFVFRYRSYPLHMKNICLKEVRMNWILGDKIQSIVKSTVDLSLHDIEDLTDTSSLKRFASLKKLELGGCHQLEHIIHDGSSAAFVNLETLEIVRMRNVRELCHNGHLPVGLLHKLQRLEIVNLPEMTHLWMDHTDPLCLVNLKVVLIEECGALKFIFPQSAAKCLSQLQKLAVSGCGMLNGIFSKGEEGNSTGKGGEITEESNDSLIHFPNLTRFAIFGLPNLRGFLSVINPKVMLPIIEDLELDENDSIKTVFDFEGLEDMTMKEDERSLLCKLQRISLRSLTKLKHLCRQVPKDVPIFQNLESLRVYGCHNLPYLFPSSIACMLVNLEVLKVEDCKGMKEVISKMNEEEEEDCGELEKNIVFPSLTHVELEGLENLSSFCSSDQQVFEFPSLEKLWIIKCPEMETFCCQIPRVAPSRMLEENVNKWEASTSAAAAGEIDIYCNQKPMVAEIKMEPSDLAALFPKLKKVNIKAAPKFRGFYNIDSYESYQTLAASSNKLTRALSTPLVGSSPDASLISNINEELSHVNDIVSSASIELFVPSSDSPVRHFNASLKRDDNQNNDLKEEGTDNSAAAENADIDESARCNTEALDHSSTRSSTPLDQGTSSKLTKALVAPLIASAPDPSPAPVFVPPLLPVSDSNQESAYSSIPDLGNVEFIPSSLSEQSVPSSDSPMQITADKISSGPTLSSSDDWKGSRVLIQGVYVKAEMRKTFEEILKENPKFLTGLRFKKAETKTMFVESAISSLQSLGQYTARTMSEEQLTCIKDSLDDLVASGLDMDWLERGYKRASLVMKERKAVLAANELASLDRKKVEAEAAFETAKAQLEEVMALRDASKAECDALFQQVEQGKELFGGGFDQDTSLGHGLLY